MNTRTWLATLSLSIALAACGGGSGPAPTSQPTPPPGNGSPGVPAVEPPGTIAPAVEPPGANAPSSASGGNSMQIGMNVDYGALYFNDRPLHGEPTISGRVLVTLKNGAPLPPDTAVTLNGQPLRHVAPYFDADPSDLQTTVESDGFLRLFAVSASAGASRELDLACPFAKIVTALPAEGASLAVGSSLTLRWTGPLSQNQVVGIGIAAPSASLFTFDQTTNTLVEQLDSVALADDATEVTLSVKAPRVSGYGAYVAELRYPGVGFLDGDGNTGGACGRTQRFIYLK